MSGQRKRQPAPPPESTFDLWFRRALRVSGLIGFFVLLGVWVIAQREVNAAWLFLIGGMLALDGAIAQIGGRK